MAEKAGSIAEQTGVKLASINNPCCIPPVRKEFHSKCPKGMEGGTDVTFDVVCYSRGIIWDLGWFMIKVLTLSLLGPPDFHQLLLLCSSWYRMRQLGWDWSLCWLPPSLSHTLAPSPGQMVGYNRIIMDRYSSPSSWPRAPPAQCSPSASSPRASSTHRPTLKNNNNNEK